MITDVLTYELKVAILIASFYMFYRLLLSKETFHKVNRCILLFTAIASFVLPFCVITITELSTVKIEVGQVLLGQGNVVEVEEESIWWQVLLLGLLIAGALVVGIRTIWSIVMVRNIIKRGERRILEDGTEVIVSKEVKGGPFSWMGYIVLSEADIQESYKSILLHERGHIEYGHSWDIIVTDILTSLQWFNPAIWMLRSDLRALHEYQADDYALRCGIDAKEYQLLLIKKAISMSGYSVANGFNHSILKNRITMMLTQKSSVRGLMKALYLIPAVGISLTAFAETKVVYESVDKDVTNNMVRAEQTDSLSEVHVIGVSKEAAKNLEKTKVEVASTSDFEEFDEDQVFMMVDQMPQYPGGDMELRIFLAQNTKYPKEAIEKGIQGRVFVSFIVNKEGYVKNVRLARGIDPSLDNEALRVIRSLPRWEPGRQRGEAVAVSYTVPINFALPKEEKQESTAEKSQEWHQAQKVENK
ncbi:MAG: M56 family metallopeptidase [Bacteroidia bacterium]|nr:M56 family metallopeptidase [Bacteroidia bacterium]